MNADWEEIAQRAEMSAKDAGHMADNLPRYLRVVEFYGVPATEALASEDALLARMVTEQAVEALRWALKDLEPLVGLFDQLHEAAVAYEAEDRRSGVQTPRGVS